MVSFIMCEDEEVLSKMYKREIDKFMMQFDEEYKCYIFSGYSKEWKELAKKSKDFKIYLLDIKTDKGSGIDAARYIREVLDDWTSMIIIISSYSEYKYEVLSKRLMIVDFISKVDNCKNSLREALSICMKHYDNRIKALKYTYKNTIYNIEFGHIIYIEKEQDSKLCKIYANDRDVVFYPGNLNKIEQLLDKRFMKVSRSVIVNLEQIKNFDIKNSVIHFGNDLMVSAISRDKKRGIIKYVRGLM